MARGMCQGELYACGETAYGEGGSLCAWQSRCSHRRCGNVSQFRAEERGLVLVQLCQHHLV